MLVVTREVGQTIRITVPPSSVEQTIDVYLTEIRTTEKARIGIEADRSIAVHRLEVQQRIDAGVPIEKPNPVRPWQK